MFLLQSRAFSVCLRPAGKRDPPDVQGGCLTIHHSYPRGKNPVGIQHSGKEGEPERDPQKSHDGTGFVPENVRENLG